MAMRKEADSNLALYTKHFATRGAHKRKALEEVTKKLISTRAEVERLTDQNVTDIALHSRLSRALETVTAKLEQAEEAAAMLDGVAAKIARREEARAYERERQSRQFDAQLRELELLHVRIARESAPIETTVPKVQVETVAAPGKVNRAPLREARRAARAVGAAIDGEMERQRQLRAETRAVEEAIRMELFSRAQFAIESDRQRQAALIARERAAGAIAPLEDAVAAKRGAVERRRERLQRRKEALLACAAKLGAFGGRGLPQDDPPALAALATFAERLSFECEVWRRTGHRLAARTLLETWEDHLARIAFFVP